VALYSVWDWNKNAWAVYQTPTSVSVGDDPTPPRPSASSPIGVDPDTAVNELPGMAKFVGYDHLCRGEVRRLPGGSGVGQTDDRAPSFFEKPAVLVAIGVAGGWLLRKIFEEDDR
jgi:hypothetical protein